MSNFSVTYKLERNTAFAHLDAVAGVFSGDGRRQILAVMAGKFRGITLETFGEAGKFRSAPWPELSERYKKRIKYFGPPKLVLSGKMRDSIRSEVVSDNAAVVASPVEYSGTHQFGRKSIPRRPFFPVKENGEPTEYAEKSMLDAAKEKINQMLGR